jgi:hypothetical protein
LAAAAIPGDVAALTERVLKNMLLTKLKTAVAAMLVTACVALGLFQVSGIGAQPKPMLITSGKPVPKGPEPAAKTLPPVELAVGKWTVEFANGVIEACEIHKDGTASVEEPKRSSSGKATVKDNAIMIAFEDDRLERWRPVGKRMVVEHWYPGNQEPAVTPVLGVAVRTTWEPGDGLTDDEKSDLKNNAWPSVSKTLGATMRTRFKDQTAGELRQFIDPVYLKENKLTEGPFPMERFLTNTDIVENRLCDDYQTGILIVQTDPATNTRELFVFRVTYTKSRRLPGGGVESSRAYILPPAPPDPITKTFKPWIFRTKL